MIFYTNHLKDRKQFKARFENSESNDFSHRKGIVMSWYSCRDLPIINFGLV